ncbi:MAG: hypothetical protein WAW91_02035 [Candidatus Nanoperiomorbaceae bacterium]
MGRDIFLSHDGVKGMKWGVRKSKDSSPTNTKKHYTRAEKKVIKQKFYQDKAENLVKTALEKQNDVLISVFLGVGAPTIVTGKQFVEHLSNGGGFNVNYTDVYAAKSSPTGPYVMNKNANKSWKTALH